jgi:isoleucyl-tRNA synthetase
MRNSSAIAEEVWAKYKNGSSEGYSKEWNINGEKVKFTVVKI